MRRKLLVVGLVLLSPPISASVPILSTDLLDPGEFYIGLVDGAHMQSRNVDVTLTPAAIQYGTVETSYGGGLSVFLGLGIHDGFQLGLGIPARVFRGNSSYSYGDFSRRFTWRDSGTGDISISAAYLLSQEKGKTVFRAKLSMPTASDESGTPEIVDNGVVTQQATDGGVGKGYWSATGVLAWSGDWGMFKPEVSTYYLWRGDKYESGVHYQYGDGIGVSVVGTFTRWTHFWVQVGAGYDYHLKSTFGNATYQDYQFVHVEPEFIIRFTPDVLLSLYFRFGQHYNNTYYVNVPAGTWVVTPTSEKYMAAGLRFGIAF